MKTKDLKRDIKDLKRDIKNYQSTISDLKTNGKAIKKVAMTKEDIIEIEMAKSKAKIAVLKAVTMTKVDEMDVGHNRKQERMD